MLRLVRTGAFFGFIGLLGFPTAGHAYCRSTTSNEVTGCPASCAKQGTPLYWATPDLHYAFNERPFEGLESAEVRRIFEDSFAAWTQVTCGDDRPRPIGLTATAHAGTTTDAVGPESEEPNDNAIVFFSGDEWTEAGYDPRAFALTSLWFRAGMSKRIGEIVGADVYFNGGMNFTECPANGCPESWGMADLQNVATHEVGHFLGLAHSDRDPAATMWCDARAGQVNKRNLSADDVDGLCDVYPPGAFDVAKASSGGCSLGGSASGAYGAPFGALALLLLGVRRRRKAAPVT